MKPAELAKLELAFASDPQSRAFIELANAYIDLSRLVEAMVVAKKGMKVHPADGHFILAKIYNKQQKYAKAVEELNQVIATDANNLQAIMFKGNIHFRLGEEGPGVDAFKRAFEIAPDNVEVKATLMEKGVDIAPKKLPPLPEEAALDVDEGAIEEEEPVERRPQRPKSGARQGIKPKRPVTRPRPAVSREAAEDEEAAHTAPARRPQPRQAAEAQAEDFSETPDWMRKQAARRTFMLVAILAALSVSIIVGIAFYAHRVRKIDALSKEITANIRLDTYASYKKARQLSAEVIKIKSDDGLLLSVGAYVDAILFGEYGEGEAVAKEGADYLEQAIKSKDQPPMFFTSQALLRFYRGDAKGAENSAMEGLQKNNQYPRLLLAMGIIQTASGNYDGALESYKRGRNFETANDPKNYDPRSLVLMADLSIRQGYAKQALAQYDFVLKNQTDHVGAILGRASLYADSDDRRRDGEREVGKVLSMPQGQASKKELAKAYFILSMVNRADGKEAEATRNLTSALDLDPQNAQFHFMLARRYVATREFERAKLSFKKAIDLDGKKPEFYREFAEMQTMTGDYDGAIQNITRAMMLLTDRDKGPYYLIRARALRLKKDYKEAQKEISKAFALNSEDPYAHFEQALLYKDQDKMDMCTAEFENAVTGFQSIQNARRVAEASVWLARILMDKNDFEPAEDLLQKAVQRDKSYPDTYYFLGVLYRAGKVASQQAREMFQTYLKLAPNGEFAGKAKKEL